jgi:hypothetical protein
MKRSELSGKREIEQKDGLRANFIKMMLIGRITAAQKRFRGIDRLNMDRAGTNLRCAFS